MPLRIMSVAELIAAVKSGDLEILPLLWHYHAGADEQIVAAAVRAGRAEVLDWLLENGCTLPPKTGAAAYALLQMGAAHSTAMLERLSPLLGPSTCDAVLSAAAERNDVETLAWLDQRVPVRGEHLLRNGYEAMVSAVNGGPEVLNWMMGKLALPPEELTARLGSCLRMWLHAARWREGPPNEASLAWFAARVPRAALGPRNGDEAEARLLEAWARACGEAFFRSE